MSNLRQYAAKSNKSPDKSPSSLQVASPRKSPSSQPSLVPYPDSESMDGDSAEETTGPPIENGHSNEDNGTSVDKYFLGPEVNQNIPGKTENGEYSTMYIFVTRFEYIDGRYGTVLRANAV